MTSTACLRPARAPPPPHLRLIRPFIREPTRIVRKRAARGPTRSPYLLESRINAPDPEALGFSFSIVPTPGMTWPQVVALERQIEDYARERELLPRGCQLRWVLSSPQRSLSAADQVELLDWIVDRPGIAAVNLSQLLPDLAAPVPLSEGYLRLTPLEPSVIGLTLLHRLGRIKPELYLEILGGFVRPIGLH